VRGVEDTPYRALSVNQWAVITTYLVLDEHSGNPPALHMVQRCGLHLISELRCDTALYLPSNRSLAAPPGPCGWLPRSRRTVYG